MKRKYSYVIYEHPDGRRARITQGPRAVSMTIRADYGQGACLLYRKYTTWAGARAALRRRGGTDWYVFANRHF